MTPPLLHELLVETAAAHPDRTAVVCGAHRATYRDVDTLSNGLAASLVRLGVRPGDRVVLFMENSLECVVSIFGALKAGAAFTCVNASSKPAYLAHVLADSGAVAVITVNDRRRRTTVQALPATARDVIPVVWVGGVPTESWRAGVDVAWDEVAMPAATGPCLAGSHDATASIIYTSGTTGAPKGVVSLHRDSVFATAAIASYLGNDCEDVLLCALSLAFTYGLYQLFTAVLVGATLVLETGFSFPHQVLGIMARERVTGFAGVPTMFTVLLDTHGVERYDLGSLRYITNAAAPMPVAQVRAVLRTFPQARFFSMYGQTECKRVCYLPPAEVLRRPDSVGIPMPGTRAWVADAAGQPAPYGSIGELVVAGPHLMNGYWNQPDETAHRLRRLPDGSTVLHTGDLFRQDADGYLYFVSRMDDIIKSRGEKVSPHEVERVVHELPGVRDVAAVGVPDDLLGEAVKVFVVLEPGTSLTAAQVRGHCARQLQDVMVPKHVAFCSELPKSDNGKTLRRSLRSCAA